MSGVSAEVMLDAGAEASAMDEAGKCRKGFLSACLFEKTQRFQQIDYKETYRVLVNKVPPNLSEQGLTNISFKMTGVQPLHCYKHQPEGQELNYTWAILEFMELSQAEAVILKLNKHPILNLDVSLGQKRFERAINCPQSSINPDVRKFSELNLSKQQEDIASEQQRLPEEEKLVGRGYKLLPCGLFTSSPDYKYFLGPILGPCNPNLNRELPVDGTGDYMGGYYEAFNSATRELFNKPVDNNKEWNLISDQPISQGTDEFDLTDREYSNRVVSNMPKFIDVTSEGEVKEEGQFGLCEICSRATSIICSTCGKSYCCKECLHQCKEHFEKSCKGDLQVPQIWQNKFASIRSGPKPVKNHQSVLPANKLDIYKSSASQEIAKDLTANWLIQGTTSLFLVESVVREFTEPVAFLCSETTVYAGKDMSEEDVDSTPMFLATVLSTKVPALNIWMNHVLEGKEILIKVLALKGSKAIGNVLSSNGAVCQVSLEIWKPFKESDVKITAAPLSNGCKVTVSHFCCSNMCYVRPWKADERLALEIEYVASNTGRINTLPKVEQVVLACSKTDGKFYRARIKAVVADNLVLVHLIDYGIKEVLPLKCIYHITAQLLQVPAEAALVQLGGISDCPFTQKFVSYINYLTLKKTKLCLTFDEQDKVHLVEADSGIKVNEKLSEDLKFLWQQDALNKNCNDLIENYTFECSMSAHSEPLPKGRPFLLTVLNMCGSEMTCCRTDSPLFNGILRTFTELAEQYVDLCPLKKYFPREKVALVQHTDGLWYRALVESRNPEIDVLFLDFGDFETGVPLSKVRKLPDELSNFPALGTCATIFGIDSEELTANKKLAERIKLILQPGTIVEGTVLQQDLDSTLIFLPDLVETLTSEGLIPTPRLISMQTSLLKMKSKSSMSAAKIVGHLIALGCESRSLKSLARLDVNQNYVQASKNATFALMDYCLDEVMTEISGAELQRVKDLENRRNVCLKMSYFSSLKKWVIKNEKNFEINIVQHEQNEEEVTSVTSEKGGAASWSKKSMLSQLLCGLH